MKISELEARQGKVDITVEIVSMDEVREFNKFGKQGRVCNANAKDESGQIKLTLWNDDIDKIKPGMKVKIENGYVNEWQGEKQLTTGKFGKMEVVGEATSVPEAAPEVEESVPEASVEEEIVEE